MSELLSGTGKTSGTDAIVLGESIAAEEHDPVFPSPEFSANADLPGAASRLFDEMPEHDAVTWKALLGCLVLHARAAAAAGAFYSRAVAGFVPTAATLCTMLKAYATTRTAPSCCTAWSCL